jgi:hypothetical protein
MEPNPNDLGVVSFVRIRKEEFDDQVPTTGLFAHFNLSKTNHKIGEKYAIVSILKQGLRSHETGLTLVRPQISLQCSRIVRCLEVQNELAYDKLSNKHFEHSMADIRTPEQLKARIIARYSPVRPDLSPSQLIDVGVGYTLFEILTS